MLIDISLTHSPSPITISYKWINQSLKGPVILFLHEGLGSIEQWKSFPQELCDELNLPGLIYERQGYGKSSPLDHIRTEAYLENYALKELPAFIKALALKQDLILFGHSDGGSIALIYTGTHSGVKGVITEAAHVFVEEITINGISPVVHAYETTDMREKLQKYHGEKTDQIFYAWSNTWPIKQAKKWNIEKYLKNIQVPILAIQGVEDEYGTEAQLDSIVLNSKGKNTKLLIKECGHSPHKDQQEIVLNASVKFINSIKP